MCRDFAKWRGPESNRRHHDFQSWVGLQSAHKAGVTGLRLSCKLSETETDSVSRLTGPAPARVGEVLAGCGVSPHGLRRASGRPSPAGAANRLARVSAEP